MFLFTFFDFIASRWRYGFVIFFWVGGGGMFAFQTVIFTIGVIHIVRTYEGEGLAKKRMSACEGEPRSQVRTRG